MCIIANITNLSTENDTLENYSGKSNAMFNENKYIFVE